jgi:hypothetical protein
MKANEKTRDWLVLLATIPVFALTWQISSRRDAVIFVSLILLFYIVISSKWHLRKSGWFWICILVFGAVHLMIVGLTNLTIPRGPAISYVVPIVFADGLIMYGLVTWLEKRLPSNKL